MLERIVQVCNVCNGYGSLWCRHAMLTLPAHLIAEVVTDIELLLLMKAAPADHCLTHESLASSRYTLPVAVQHTTQHTNSYCAALLLQAMEHYDNTAGGRIDGGEGGTPQAVPPWHGTSGPVATTPPLLIDEVAPFFLASCKGAGIPIVEDFNKPGTRHGAGLYTFAINNGVRDSAARAMLGPILSGKLPRPNLKVRESVTIVGMYSVLSLVLATDSIYSEVLHITM
jgi:hypothetical protein